jgi:hypothetical protein
MAVVEFQLHDNNEQRTAKLNQLSALAGGSAFTSGGLLFANSSGAIAQDPTVLFWDNTNNYLGVLTNAPGAPLHVVGTVRSSGANGIFQAMDRNGDGTVAGFYRDNGVAHLWNNAAGNVFSYNASGNAGVNDSTPDYRFDVNGTFGFTPGNSVTPAGNGDVVFEFTNNTTITVKGKGSDGAVRTATITLA